MPLHRYSPRQSPCKLCGDGFDLYQEASAAALESCPKCGQSVTRAPVQAVNTPKILKPLSVTDAKKLGFTVLKRTSGGEYEKQ